MWQPTQQPCWSMAVRQEPINLETLAEQWSRLLLKTTRQHVWVLMHLEWMAQVKMPMRHGPQEWHVAQLIRQVRLRPTTPCSALPAKVIPTLVLTLVVSFVTIKWPQKTLPQAKQAHDTILLLLLLEQPQSRTLPTLTAMVLYSAT